MISCLVFMMICALLVYAACIDVSVREIPDWVSLVFLVLAIGDGASTIWRSLPGSALAFFLLFLLWKAGGIGGGDVKLITASSLFFGPQEQLFYFLNIGWAGGLLALLYAAGRGRLPLRSRGKACYARVMRVESWRIRRGGPLPYAVAIAVGFVVTALQG